MTRPWTDRYVGLPWRDKGRGPEGFDCYGLHRHVLALERGLELPMYLEGYTSALDAAAAARAVAGALPDWAEIPAADAREFDAVRLRGGGGLEHVGTYAGRGRMLHVTSGGLSVLARLDSPAVAPRVLGFYRWRGGA